MDKKWEIIFDYLMLLIRENKVRPGEILPSQNMLKTKYKFSEQPIRIAFNKLIELKLVKAVNGKGYVVLDKIQNNLLFSFREIFPNSTSEYFGLEEFIVDENFSKKSKFYKGTVVLKYRCIRRDSSKNIVIYQESFIPKEIFYNISINFLNQFGLMKFIEEKTSILPSHSAKKISFETLEQNSEILKYTNNFKLNNFILDEGNLYSIFGENLEYRLSYYNPKYFSWEFIEWRK